MSYVPVTPDRSLKSVNMFANASMLPPVTSQSMSASTSCSSSTYVARSRVTAPESSNTAISARSEVISGQALSISNVRDLL